MPVYQLQNCSGYSSSIPTIIINKKDNNWVTAYKNWLSGKNPTESKEWKNGCFALVKPFHYILPPMQFNALIETYKAEGAEAYFNGLDIMPNPYGGDGPGWMENYIESMCWWQGYNDTESEVNDKILIHNYTYIKCFPININEDKIYL